MTFSLAGWHRSTVDGGVMLVAPEPINGAIRIRTGIPLRPAVQVVRAVAVPFGGAPFEPVSPPRAFVTHEGEHAALFELHARPAMHDVWRTIAVVIGDRTVATVDGRAGVPDSGLTAIVESLARSFSLGLGTDRWRRPFYRMAAEWHRQPRFRADVWLAPEVPRQPGIITVFHARPIIGPSHEQHVKLFEQLTSEYGGEPLERRMVRVPSGLEGQLLAVRGTVDGVARRVTTVVLRDRLRVYGLRLETDAEDAANHGPTFERVVASLEPIPAPQSSGDALAAWSE